MLTNKKYSGKIPLVVGAAVVAAVLMVLLPLTGCKTEVDPVDPPAKYVEIKLTVSGNTVELASVPAGATIHYTTDGTDPKTSGTRQTGTSVPITQKTTIRAYATKEGLKDGVAEKTYCVVTFNANGATGEMAAQVFASGEVQKLAANGFSRADSAFAGWAENSGGPTVRYTDGQEIAVTVDTTLYALWGVASVRVSDGTVTPYDIFDDAFTAAMQSTGSTLTLLADISRSSTISISSGDFTLDLNGKAITSSVITIIETSGSASLTVTDTSAGQTGSIKPDSETAKSGLQMGIRHGSSGKLTISGGSITAATSSSSNSYGVNNQSSGTVEITGGTIAGGETAGSPSIGVRNAAGGSVTISGGSISGGRSTASNSYGVLNSSSGVVKIIGGKIIGGETVSLPSVGVYNAETGTVTISGGSISGGPSTASNSYGVNNYSSGIVEISGGTITSYENKEYPSAGVLNRAVGTVTISGGSISGGRSTDSNSYGVWNFSSGTVEITDGTIAGGETTGNPSAGVWNQSDGKVTISGGNVNGGPSNSNSYGVCNDSSGIVEISGGTITAAKVFGEGPSAALGNRGSGTVTISGTPTITGGPAAVSNSYGVWNHGGGAVKVSGRPSIVGGSAGSGKVSASFRVQQADTDAITLESGFAPASGTSYSVYVGTATTPAAGIFAKPGTGATLDASWFTSYDTSKFTVEKVGDNLELVAVP